jgi:hypothetical protein
MGHVPAGRASGDLPGTKLGRRWAMGHGPWAAILRWQARCPGDQQRAAARA